MYRKRDREQLYLEDFTTQFGGKLKADNRWVKEAAIIPWDTIEEIYSMNFAEGRGAEAIDSRIAFGAIYIKGKQKLTDRETVEYIAENPYVQYFLGLKEFREEPLFDPSMMVHFRKRFPAEEVCRINRMIFEAEHEIKTHDDNDDDDNASSSGWEINGEQSRVATENKGKLLFDASCVPADIRYPNDLSLLNEARENLEVIIDELWGYANRKGHKTNYSRKKARKEYLAIAKQRQPKPSKISKAIGKQLRYIKKDIDAIGKMLLDTGVKVLQKKRINRIKTICKLYRQQHYMHTNNVRVCEDRILSLRQPHIRPIVRGKSGKKYEFGQKIAISVIDGYTFIEHQSYDNFNEGIRLISGVERYKARYGFYPEAVLADKLYRNRANLAYCKERGIRLSGPRLGRPRQNASEDREQTYRDSCERNTVESRIGIAKRRFSLDLVLAYLPETSMTEVALQILCMNISLKMKSLFEFLFRSFFKDIICFGCRI